MQIKEKYKNISLVSIGTLINYLINFVTQLIILFFYGAQGITDAFFMARSIADSLGKFIFLGQASEIFLPFFSQQYKHNKESAWKFFNSILFLFTASIIIIIILVSLFKYNLVQFFAPGFSQKNIELTIQFIGGWIIYILLMFIFDLLRSLLYYFKEFKIPMIGDIFSSFFALIFFLLLNNTLGIIALLFGYLIGRLISILYLFIKLKKEHHFSLSFPMYNEEIKKYILSLKNFILLNLSTFASSYTYKMSVSFLPEGTFSIIEYGRRIFNLIFEITFSAIGNVAFPDFVKDINKNILIKNINKNFKLVLYTAISITIFIFIFGTQLTNLAFAHGSFNTDDAKRLSLIIIILSISYMPNGLYFLLRKAVLALKKIKVVIILGIVNELIQAILYIVLGTRYGYLGIIYSMVIATFIIFIMYYSYFAFARRMPIYPINFFNKKN